MSSKLDLIDLKILNNIQQDCSQSYDSLSEKINLSPTACLRRIKKLEKVGYIDGKYAVLNAQKLGYGVKAIISVELSQDVLDLSERLSIICAEAPQIQQCFITSSNADFMVIVVFKSAEEFTSFLDNLISIFHNLAIREYESAIVVRTVVDTRAFHLLEE